MNIFPETTKRDKVIRMFLAFLLVFGILPVSIMADIDEAWATTNEAIKHNEIVARNPLVIMDSRTNWLKHGATRFSPVEVVSSDQPDMIANRVSTLSNDRNLTRYQISRYRTEIINSVTDGETKSGYTIEFPSCVNEGDTATVNLKYPIVGTYNGRRVGAFVTYTLTHQDRVMTPCVNDYAGTMDYTHSAIQLGDSLFAGLDMCNVKYCDSTIEFFYADDNSRVTLGDDAFFTIGSLSWGPAFPMSETAMVLNSKTSKIQIPDANDPGTLGNIKVKTDGVTSTTYAFRDDGWSDVKEDPSFYKQSASFFQAGSSLDFRISAVTLEVDGTEHHGGTMWWSLSSSSIATPEQPKPVKDVDKPEASKGETITYTIEQEVHTAGMDIQGRYASFVFRDSLPQEVDYASGSAKMYQVVNGAESDITASAGSLDYDAASHTLSYIFNHEYLRTMLMQGETYRLVFDTVVKDSIVGNEVIANKAGTIINEHEVETNPALTLINDPRLSLVKKVNAFEQGIGDKALYTLQLSNAVEGTVAKNVVLYDDSLPDHLRFNISSVNVSGIPGAIDYPVVKENVAGTESRANAYRISPSGSNGFQLAIDYLPFGSTVTITYEAEVSAPANVKTTVNTAMASAANADRVQANDIVWVNNAALLLAKASDAYEWRVGQDVGYSLVVENTVIGSIAKGITVEDVTLPEFLELDIDSVAVNGVPESIDYVVRDTDTTAKTESYPNTYAVTPSSNGFTVAIDYLPAKTPVTITYQAKAHAESNGLEVVNTASATLSNPLLGHEKVEASDIVWINSPDITPTKTSDDVVHKVGDTIKYTIDLTNRLTGTVARNVVLTDTIMTPGVELDRNSIVVFDEQGEIITDKMNIIQNRDVQGFTIETFLTLVNPENYWIHNRGSSQAGIQNPLGYTSEKGVYVEYSVKVVSAELAGKDIENVVTTSCDENPGGSDDEIIPINGPVLNITKKASKQQISVGDSVDYLLAVGQIREGLIARNVVIEDAFADEGMEIDYDSVKVYDTEWGEIENCDITAIDQGFTIATHRDISNSEKIFVSYSARSLCAFDKLVNIASAQADNAKKVIDKATISSSGKPAPVVITTKTSDPVTGTIVNPGDIITYNLLSTNIGLVASHVLVRDYIPEGTTYVEGSVSENGVYVAENEQGNVTNRAYVEFFTSEVAVGDAVSGSFKVTVNKDTTDLISNHGLTTTPEQPLVPGDPSNPEPETPTNNVEHPVLNDPVIEVIKTSDPESGTEMKAGDTVTYFLGVTNVGDVIAQDIAVFDAIPEGTTYVDGSISQTAAEDGAGDIHSVYLEKIKGVSWHISALEAGEKIILSFQVSIDTFYDDKTSIDNVASFESGHPTLPEGPLENPTNEVSHPLKPYSVDAVKSSDPESGSSVAAGAEITYYVSLANTGGSTAKNIAVFDEIPKYTTYVSSDSVHNATCHHDKNAIGWNVDILEPGQIITLAFKVKVDVNIKPGTKLRNVASFSSETPGIPSERLDRDTNEVTHGIPALQASPKGSVYDKTGNSFSDFLPALITFGATTLIMIFGYSIRQYVLARKESGHGTCKK